MATIIVGILLVCLVAFILYLLIKNRKKGGCGQGCSGCKVENCVFCQETRKQETANQDHESGMCEKKLSAEKNIKTD